MSNKELRDMNERKHQIHPTPCEAAAIRSMLIAFGEEPCTRLAIAAMAQFPLEARVTIANEITCMNVEDLGAVICGQIQTAKHSVAFMRWAILLLSFYRQKGVLN